MSNSSSVGGPGGAGATPYTDGTPDKTDQTGQTNDHRKVRVHPGTGQTHIPDSPDDSVSPPPSPIAKRKVVHHPGGKKLKSMPDTGDGFKPLGKGNPIGDGATPSGSSQRRGSLTGQAPSQPGVSPKVSVESSGKLTPLPPLTEEQQEQKSKLLGAFKLAFSFVKAHKNSFAMGGGAALMIVGIALMAFPPTAMIGIFPAVFGYVALTTGFSFAMMNTDSGGPTPPPDQPKNENEEKKKKDDKPDDGSGLSSGATPKGHFAKIDNTTGASVTATAELSDTDEASAEVMTRKRHMLNLQRHMEAELRAAFQEDEETRAVSGTPTTGTSITTSLEDKVLGIAAEYAIRAGLNADDDVVTNIVESGKLIAKVMAETEGRSQEESQREFQTLVVSLAQRPGIPEDAVRMLCGAFDDLVENKGHLLLVENKGHLLNEAVKTAIRSTSALLKAILDHQHKPPEPSEGFPQPKPVSSSQPRTSSGGRPVSLIGLEAALDLDSVHDPDKDLKNMQHMRQLKDAIEAQGSRESMEQREVELVKKRLFGSSLDLLNETLSTADFKAALASRVDQVASSKDHEFLEKALNGHKWFRGSS